VEGCKGGEVRLKLLTIGKLKKQAMRELAEDYTQRIQKMHSFEVMEIPAESIPETQRAVPLQKETKKIQSKLKPNTLLCCLDEKGKQFTSAEFAQQLEQDFLGSYSEIVFMIGGAYGLDEKLKQQAQRSLSLGKPTLPHQLARVLFLEQLYRALTIIKHVPYHHE